MGEGLVDKLSEEPDLELAVRWLPFELHEGTPAEGIPLSQYFGVAPERVQEMQEALRERAQGLGLEFNAPRILSNTRKAHILSEYAREEGKLDTLRRALFRANFADGMNLSDDGVLREVAERAGLDADAAMAAIEDERYAKRVDAALERSRDIGITGVPTLIVDGRYMIVGAHPIEALSRALHRIAAGEV